jgi:hypothetical protein
VFFIRLVGWMVPVVLAYHFGGVTVGVIATAVAFLFFREHQNSVASFAPFLVAIRFKPEFLTETGIATEAQLVPPVIVPSAAEYWPRRDGITFTVLRLGLFSSEENLIYWNDTRRFSTKFEPLVVFSEFERPAPLEMEILRDLGKDTVTPWVEMEQGADGFELWVSATGPTSNRKLAALIPCCMFDAPRLKGGKLPPNKRDSVLKKHGWTQDEPTDLGEFGQRPGDFQHRYLTISVRYI